MKPARAVFRMLLGRRLPVTEGDLEVPGIAAPVTIRRDRWGIPSIDAASEEDGWFGLGFCHGQDRPFQVELLRRVASGTLAALIGKEGIPVDRLARRIGFLRGAEEHLRVLEPGLQRAFDAYARGVTAGARIGLPRRPHELALLGSRPTPWRASDIIGILRLQCFLFATNADVELARLKILQTDGPEALAALDPSYPAWLPVTSPVGAEVGRALDCLAADLESLDSVAGSGASNSWAISGSLTASGRPLLACDPHLPPLLPSPWYLVRISTPEWSIAGASFVGGPAVPAGFNGHAAWGVTAGFADTTDLFVEEIGPDRRSVRRGDRFVPCEVHLERIDVRWGRSVLEEVLVTPSGPIIGDALEDGPGAVSLRVFWLDPQPLRGLLHAPRVRSFEEFREAFRQWPAPSLSMTYADVSGRIGWVLVGWVPRRRKGWGTIPLPAWDPGAGWEAPVPYEDMPHLADPGCGFVANANNRPVAGDAEPFLGFDWVDGYRLARIIEMLGSRRGWDVAAVQQMQTDVESIPWREVRDIVLAAPAADPAVRRGCALLERWDGRIAAESPAASVFELLLAELSRRAGRAKAPNSWEWAVGRGFHDLVPVTSFGFRRVGHLVDLLRERPEGWFAGGWEAEVADALATVVRQLESSYGPDPAGWAWGRVRPLTMQHPVGEKKPLNKVFNLGPFPWGGDPNTVALGGVDAITPGNNPWLVPSLRMVVDVGEWSRSRFVLPGGQSGNPLSPHYDDLLPLWRRGEGVPIPWTEEEVRAGTVATLRLLPAVVGGEPAGGPGRGW